MSEKIGNRIGKLASAVMSLCLAAGMAVVPTAMAEAAVQNPGDLYVPKNAGTFTTSYNSATENKIVTWNKIDSQTDYDDFIELTKQEGGVKILLVFTDSVTGEKSVIGGYDWEKSSVYSMCSIQNYNRYYPNYGGYYGHQDGNNKLYWISATTGSAVQEIFEYTDGLSGILNGESQVVTCGNAGSLTAVAASDDGEDFYLLPNTNKHSTEYLTCQEGDPLFWEWKEGNGNGYYIEWTLPYLNVRSSTETQSISWTPDENESGHGEDADRTVTLYDRSAWKLGQWSTSVGSNEKRWDVQYIYQDTEDARLNYDDRIYTLDNGWYATDGSGDYRDMGQWCYWYNGDYLKYGYTLLAAQNHSDYAFFTACQWCTHKTIDYYDGPDILYSCEINNEVVGAVEYMPFKDSNYSSYQWRRNTPGSDTYNYKLQCGFEVYYGVDGISKTALYENSNLEHNANATAQNLENESYVVPVSTLEIANNELESGVLTIKNSQAVLIPEGMTLKIDEGATLVVSRNAVLILNGTIWNKGTILVQPGGMILRYNSTPPYAGIRYGSYTTNTGDSYIYNEETGAIELAVTADGTIPYIMADNDIYFGYAGDSFILCDGGNLLVREGGRVRVSNLATSLELSWTAKDIKVLLNEACSFLWSVDYWMPLSLYTGSDSVNKSTFYNCGYVLAANIYYGGETVVENYGTITNGYTYATDMLTGISTDTLKKRIEANLSYSGYMADRSTTSNS